MPTATPAYRPWLFPLFVLGTWSLFTLMVMSISWAVTSIHGRKPNVPGMLTWNLGWLLWAPQTFVVIRLARRFPLERTHRAAGISAHLVLGLLVAFIHLCVEFGLGRVIEAFWLPRPALRTTFVSAFAYKFHVYFVIYWMIVGAARARDYYGQYRETLILASRLDAKLAQARLTALREQLQPHFLFNAHHSIVALMLKNDNPAAIAMLTRLSDLLRMTLDRTDDQFASLKEELQALDLYLAIQKERYRERLAVRIDVPAELHSAQVPSFLLQPLVENAIKHGVEVIATPGVLEVHIWRAGGILHLSVKDNGPGLSPLNESGLKSRASPANGIGLRNTVARLRGLYGDAHRFQILAVEPTGTEVRICIPFQETGAARTHQRDALHE